MLKQTLQVELALLGFLHAEPTHAYEIFQRMQHAEALGLVWNLKQSQLYALLARLEAEELISAVLEPQGSRPPRKLLQLTPAGAAAFERWLVEPVDHGRDFRLEFLAKLFFAQRHGSATVEQLIANQEQTCAQWLARLDTQIGELPAARIYDRLVLQFRVGQIAAIVAWMDQCRTALLDGVAPEP